MKKLIALLATALILASAYVMAQRYFAQQIRLQARIIALELQQHPAIDTITLDYESNGHNGLLTFHYRVDEAFFTEQLGDLADILPSSWWQQEHQWRFQVRQGPLWHPELGLVLARLNSSQLSPFEGISWQGTDVVWLGLDRLLIDSQYDHVELLLDLDGDTLAVRMEQWRQRLNANHELSQWDADASIEALRVSLQESGQTAVSLHGQGLSLTLAQQQQAGIWLGEQDLALQHLRLVDANSGLDTEVGPLRLRGTTDQMAGGIDLGVDLRVAGLPMAWLGLDNSDWHWQLNAQGLDPDSWRRLAKEGAQLDEEPLLALLAELLAKGRISNNIELLIAEQSQFQFGVSLEQPWLLSDWQAYIDSAQAQLSLSANDGFVAALQQWIVDMGVMDALDMQMAWSMIEPYLEYQAPEYRALLETKDGQLWLNQQVNDELQFLLEMLLQEQESKLFDDADMDEWGDWGDWGFDPDVEPDYQAPDVQAPYRQTQLLLANNYYPNPQVVPLLIDLSQTGRQTEDCFGYFDVNGPDVRLTYQAEDQPLFLYATSEADTLLLVQTPDGEWHCNDDGIEGTLHPMLSWDRPQQGTYLIWLGSFDHYDSHSALLHLADQDPSPELADYRDDWFPDDSEPLQVALPYRQQYLQLASTPLVTQSWPLLMTGGAQQSSTTDWLCTGFVNAQGPDALMLLTADVTDLYLAVESGPDQDSTLIVQGPDGQWICDDDGLGRDLDAMIHWPLAAEGEYRIWVGSFHNLDEPVPATLMVTGDDPSTDEDWQWQEQLAP